jgi:hypothetical protein
VDEEGPDVTGYGVPSYQERLRKLGAWLDGAYAHCVVVREGLNGFAVRYERQDIDGVFIQRFFTHEELRSLRRGDWTLRRTLVRRIGHKLQGVAGEPGGYQDLFRALGYALDAAGASQVQISEDASEGKLAMTYQVYRAPEEPAQKLVKVFGREEREAMRKSARSRRVERRLHAIRP